jgi:hypothetical protein
MKSKRSSFHSHQQLVALLLFLSFGHPAGADSVRKVDFNQTPDMKELAEHARGIGNELYPKVLALMDDGSARLPRQFDIIFKKHIEVRQAVHAMGFVKSGNIYLSADWFTTGPTNQDGMRKARPISTWY